jgi:hypothetical protein
LWIGQRLVVKYAAKELPHAGSLWGRNQIFIDRSPGIVNDTCNAFEIDMKARKEAV